MFAKGLVGDGFDESLLGVWFGEVVAGVAFGYSLVGEEFGVDLAKDFGEDIMVTGLRMVLVCLGVGMV